MLILKKKNPVVFYYLVLKYLLFLLNVYIINLTLSTYLTKMICNTNVREAFDNVGEELNFGNTGH